MKRTKNNLKGIIYFNTFLVSQYVHLSSDIKTAYKVGQRHRNPVVLTILAYEMYLNGVKFYLSENGVYLTEYVDPKWISKWELRKINKIFSKKVLT